jgi:phosphotransferase system HPr (HPr) family protein
VGKYLADVIVKKGSQSVSAASILGLLSLAVTPGTELVLSATGAEAQEALDAVAGLFASDFQAC